MKYKVTLLLMFKIGLLNANLLLSLAFVDFTNMYERCTIFQKLAASSVKIFLLNDRDSWLHLLPFSFIYFKNSHKTVFAQHSHVF